MLKDVVLAILNEAGENYLLTDAVIRQRLDSVGSWHRRPTEAEITEVLRLIESEHGTVTGIFAPDGEGYEFGIALKSKIKAMPENCILLVGIALG